jgi:very-short-patch-repair endonuclease
MFDETPPYHEVLAEQGGVISRTQCVELGLDTDTVENQLRYGRWQQFQRGVYATFTGDPKRMPQLWATLLRAGSGATVSHQTAAELHGMIDKPSPMIHITVPADRNPARCGKIPGVVIHRSSALGRTRHPVASPPRTRVEDTVLDLVQASAASAGSAGFDEAYDWICRGIGRRLTTAKRIRSALDARPKFPRRGEVELALADAADGALSNLELWYLRGVERAHGLPAARRQARIRLRTGNRYLDNLYEEYRLCVEIDGATAHPGDEQWRDKRRDRWNAVHGQILTLRLGYLDLRDQPSRCETAADVATVLRDRGPAIGSPCRRAACPVKRPP